MKRRTKRFALEVIALVESLPKSPTTRRLGDQLLRSGKSVFANYRAACRAKSPPHFLSKMGDVEEEADESVYEMELLVEGGIVTKDKVSDLMREADEILRITVAPIRTARGNML